MISHSLYRAAISSKPAFLACGNPFAVSIAAMAKRIDDNGNRRREQEYQHLHAGD
jgi:hypothetical protein